jgi:ABC-type Fe3+/spermidine/putrescine transport system ATPase subunit
MNKASATSCQYIPSDTQKEGLSLIHGTQVSCIFDGRTSTTAVNNVDFSIEEGQITAIIGESGSGKSTLLKLIYGLIEPNTGEIRYRGWLIPTPKDKLIPGHDSMRLVSQGFDDLNHYAKVWDNIASQLSNTDLELKERSTNAVLKKLRIDHLAQQRVADLSGGERQRVAIARALINEPEVLLMDEPFNQVDAAFRDALQQDVQKIVKETGLTVILVSHDPTEVLAMADQMMVMKKGKIMAAGSPQKLYFEPQNAYTAQLLAKSNILTTDKAKKLGIQTTQSIAVHQEWIKVKTDQQGSFEIKDIRFRGLYDEYVLVYGDIHLHAIARSTAPLPMGSKVDIAVERWVELHETNVD